MSDQKPPFLFNNYPLLRLFKLTAASPLINLCPIQTQKMPSDDVHCDILFCHHGIFLICSVVITTFSKSSPLWLLLVKNKLALLNLMLYLLPIHSCLFPTWNILCLDFAIYQVPCFLPISMTQSVHFIANQTLP